MTSPVVEKIFQETRDLLSFLSEHSEPSLEANVDATARKVLLLACASYFEHAITSTLEGYVTDATGAGSCIAAFVKAKAISRQYHTYFNWDAKNANQFFGLFGQHFRDWVTRRLAADADLQKGVVAFLELGSERNRMVHQDFGSFVLEKTTAEVFETYGRASYFVERMGGLLRDFDKERAAASIAQ